MNFVSAYLIMQKADADDPIHPKQEEKSKSWFKELFRAHLMDFPKYMGLDYDLGDAGRLVGEVHNMTKQGEITGGWKYIMTSIEDFPQSPAYWALKEYGTCSIPSTTSSVDDVPYVSIMEYQTVKHRYSTIKRLDDPGTGVTWLSGRVSNYPSMSKRQYIEGVVGDAEIWLYALPCTIKVPLFTNREDGAAYAMAAGNYYYNPTPENYETLCHYIDLCDNPDG